MNRRTFLFGTIGAAATRELPPRLATFREWLKATRETRKNAIEPLVDFIRERNAEIQAWVQVKPQQPTGDGPLAEIPFGAKDILETKGLSTEYGSPIYKGRIGTDDAAVVRQMRQRGAVLLGKTQSTAFAYRTPAPTRNPRNLAHTPGGSSSGSAAAVAAAMVPLAIGTQTGGSVLRPASFCGVTGFKPTYGLISTEGVFPFAKSLDTVGFFTHSAADMLAFWTAFGRPSGVAEDLPIGVPDPLPEVDPPMAAAFDRTIAGLRQSGVAIRSIDIASMLAKLVDASRTVMFFEGARVHEQRFKQYGDRLADMANLVREGLRIPQGAYRDALAFIAVCRRQVAEAYQATPVIALPAAPGPAPVGLASTGDSRLNAPWTALGTPAITIPMLVGNAMPLGLQLTAAQGEDSRVINAAVKVETLLRVS